MEEGGRDTEAAARRPGEPARAVLAGVLAAGLHAGAIALAVILSSGPPAPLGEARLIPVSIVAELPAGLGEPEPQPETRPEPEPKPVSPAAPDPAPRAAREPAPESEVEPQAAAASPAGALDEEAAEAAEAGGAPPSGPPVQRAPRGVAAFTLPPDMPMRPGFALDAWVLSGGGRTQALDEDMRRAVRLILHCAQPENTMNRECDTALGDGQRLGDIALELPDPRWFPDLPPEELSGAQAVTKTTLHVAAALVGLKIEPPNRLGPPPPVRDPTVRQMPGARGPQQGPTLGCPINGRCDPGFGD